MADFISLSAGVRGNLLNLTQTEKMMQNTNHRLATGRDVNFPIDNPTNYFAARNLNDRSDDLNARLDSIGQAVQTVKAAEAGTNAIRDLIQNMQATIQQALDESEPEMRRHYGKQFNELLEQAQEIAKDSHYQGVNLLQGNELLMVQFGERFDQSVLNIDGFNITGPGIQDDGTKRTRSAVGEVAQTPVTGQVTLGPTPFQASQASQAQISSRASIPTVASIATQASVAAITSQASIASQSAQASQASEAAIGTWPSQASQAGQVSVASQSSLPSRASIASVASQGSRGSIAAVHYQPSQVSQASQASTGAFTRVAEYAFTLNASKSDIGTDKVVGIQSYGLDALSPVGHEIDWGVGAYKDVLKELSINLETFDDELKVQLSNLASNMSVLTIREEFTQELMTTLEEGADKLVLADMNEEGANLLALQTRQQLGLEALSLSTRQSQAVLRLLG